MIKGQRIEPFNGGVEEKVKGRTSFKQEGMDSVEGFLFIVCLSSGLEYKLIKFKLKRQF